MILPRATLALCAVLCAPAALAADARIPSHFWNGSDRVALAVDAGTVGVLFERAVPEGAAKAAVARVGIADAAGLASAVYVPGHVLPVPVRAAASADEVIAAARALAAGAGVLAAGPRLLAGEAAEEPYFVTGEILVRWRADADAGAVSAQEAAHGLARAGVLDYSRNAGVVYRVASQRALDSIAIANALYESGLAEFAHPDFSIVRVPFAATNDALFGNQWHLDSTGQAGAKPDADVDAPEAWDVTRGDPSIVVAIVDTGVELAHPDLVPNLVPGTDVLDDDTNPQAQDFLFGLFTENHGTSTAGIACGRGDNGIGISGAAQLCRIMPIRFLSEFIFVQPTIQDEADAFNFARANGAAIVNNSWGPVGAAPLPASTKAAIDDAVANGRNGLGTMIFFAAGNESASVDQNGYAAYAKTIAVSASTDQDTFASYSNFGNSLDVCAPSNGGVTSGTWTTDRFGSVGYSAGDYTGAFGGTSSASPLAAGVAALVMSANPYLSWDEVRDVLRTTADPIDPAGGAYNGAGYSTKYGYGKVNARAAVVEAASRPPHGVVLYGTGLAGTGGLVPVVGANSVPKAGNATFAITLEDALPNAASYLLLGIGQVNLQVYGGTLLVDLFGPSFVLALNSGATGALAVPAPIPSTPSPVGIEFNAQWIVTDPGAVQGYAFSNGLEATIQP